MEIAELKSQGVMILGLKGRLDASNANTVEQKVLGLIDAGENRWVIDLGQLDYISSAGLRVLLMAAKRLRTGGGKIALASLQDHVKEVFDIAGFSAIFAIYANRDAAIAAVE